jgi:hypothetical protein
VCMYVCTCTILSVGGGPACVGPLRVPGPARPDPRHHRADGEMRARPITTHTCTEGHTRAHRRRIGMCVHTRVCQRATTCQALRRCGCGDGGDVPQRPYTCTPPLQIEQALVAYYPIAIRLLVDKVCVRACVRARVCAHMRAGGTNRLTLPLRTSDPPATPPIQRTPIGRLVQPT